jgi:hypothetical protein
MSRPSILRTLARLLAPWRTIRRLEQSNQRLRDAIDDPELTGIALEQGAMTLGMQGSGPRLLAGMFLGLLEESPQAINYLQLTFDSSKGPILVTVQRPGGASPHTLRAQAEQEARALRAELERLRSERAAEQEDELHG